MIVNDIRRQSLDLGIRFQAELHYPEPGAFDSFDVGIILQNLLLNAVEACEKIREGEVVFGPDGLPGTTKKEDTPIHGIGLSNVRRETEKYMGGSELKAIRQEFFATVLLQERSRL